MKKYIFLILIVSSSVNLHSQIMPQAIKDGKICDSLFWTTTDYPVRLINDVLKLQKSISDQLVMYPEDLDKTVEFTYRYTVTCAGIAIHSKLESHKGNYMVLSPRILKILDANCTFSPALSSDQPVNSYYYLTIVFKKGKVYVIPQNENEMPR